MRRGDSFILMLLYFTMISGMLLDRCYCLNRTDEYVYEQDDCCCDKSVCDCTPEKETPTDDIFPKHDLRMRVSKIQSLAATILYTKYSPFSSPPDKQVLPNRSAGQHDFVFCTTLTLRI